MKSSEIVFGVPLLPEKKKQVSFHNNLTLNLKTPFYIQPKKVYVARERKRKQIYREYEKYYY